MAPQGAVAHLLERNVMFTGKKLLIFDLGGVLIDLHLERTFAALVEMGADASMLTERECLLNTMMKQFDCGTITTEEMFGYIASQLPLQTREKFGAALGQRIGDVWNMMLGSYPLYKFNRLRELRSRGFRVVMLSNTNAGHWGEIERKFLDAAGEPLSSFFDALYLSYLMHCRKPEPEIFLSLLAKEGVAAGEALFFDDSAENCEAARALGLDAVLLERNAPWSGGLMNF